MIRIHSFCLISFSLQIIHSKDLFMWNYLRSLIVWLHEPEHVARFQQYLGVEPKSNQQPDLIPTFESNNLNKNNNNNNNRISDDDDEKSSSSTGVYRRHLDGKILYDSNVLDECLEEIKHNADPKKTKYDSSEELDYRITSWFWYYFFQFGAALGNEIFYILFFPTWVWNVDGAVARKISILWAFFMYVGQATKDILAIPRPSTPPVTKLEKR